jgi:hypothetical protein
MTVRIASTVPPYKTEDILICTIKDLDSTDTKTLRALKRSTYNKISGETTVSITALQNAAGTVLAAPSAVGTALPATPAPEADITLTASASTGDENTYLWEVSIDSGAFASVATTAVAVYEAGLNGVTYDFRLTVTDSIGRTSVATPAQVTSTTP